MYISTCFGKVATIAIFLSLQCLKSGRKKTKKIFCRHSKHSRVLLVFSPLEEVKRERSMDLLKANGG